MIALHNIQRIYFLGIGGIGMSALARYFHAQGKSVSGYDKTETVLTKRLQYDGILVSYDDVVSETSEKPDLVVYTPAIPANNVLFNFYRDNGTTLMKRSEVLQIVSEGSFNICVAGTHGKTTITTMIAHLLRDSGYGCNAFLGGISVNYNTNFWEDSRNVCVIEADEYDRSFLRLSPDIAVISAMDADHLDIYGTEAALEDAFVAFAGKVKPGGLLINKFGLSRGKELTADRHLSYSLQNERADVHAVNILINNGSYYFDVVMPEKIVSGLKLNMGGMHNLENAVAAVAVASSLGIGIVPIRTALDNFKGIKRRFEYIVRRPEFVYIDDYAHHPEELKALLNGVKTLFKGRKCTIIFQPHLFSRTRDFADGFAKSLDLADEVILLPIYPARELPIEGVTSEIIKERMTNENCRIMTASEVKDWITNVYTNMIDKTFGDVLITAGAGDIDQLVEPIKNQLSVA